MKPPTVLREQDLSLARKIFKKDRERLWAKNIKSQDDQEDLDKFLDLAYDYLVKDGYEVFRSNFCVEFYYYQVNGEEKKTDFGWHPDNGGVFGDCNAVLFYLKKDTTLIGGDLLWDSEEDPKKIILESDTVVIIDGDMEHYPEPFSGHGERILISTFFSTKIEN
jgi:hypothetical protein